MLHPTNSQHNEVNMFKQKFVLEVKGNNDRTYFFECDPQAPLGEIHDALFAMKNAVVKQIQAQNDVENASEEKSDCGEECEKEQKEEE